MTQPAPPTPWLLAYRLLGLRLPAEYRGWVAADVAKKSFLNWRSGRTVVWGVVYVALYYVGQTAVHQRPGRVTVYRAMAGVFIVALLASRNSLVRRTLRWQRIDKHGRPVAPKKLAVLDNQHAAILGAGVLVAYTAAMTLVFGYGQRATGAEAIPCRPPDERTMELLRAGLKDKSTSIENAQAVPFAGDSQLVVSVLRRPGVERASGGFWIVQGDTVYEIRQPSQAAESLTTFEPPPNPDRIAVEALQRALNCMTRARNR